MRDDFTQSTKDKLGNRVGWKCSNPSCKKLTRGAGKEGDTVINIDVAAHICAAAPGGPRYDAMMSSEERKSFENGIWLCQTCSKLIDADINRYTVSILRKWKDLAEESTIQELSCLSTTANNKLDKEIVKFLGQCLDRPAFQERISQEGRMEDFDKAIQDTIIAFNTGVLRTREGEILKENEGKSAISNEKVHQKLESIVDMLLALRRRLAIAKQDGEYESYGEDRCSKMYLFKDRNLENWFDSMREEINNTYASACKDAGLPTRYFHWINHRW